METKIAVSELRQWEMTPISQKRWEEWITGNHGARGDLRNSSIAWTPLTKSLSRCRLALVSTGGIHLKSQPPFDLLNHDGDWSYREIPSDSSSGDLTVSHSHYNHLDADRDVNCMFPIDRVRELRDEKVIGGLVPTFFGLMGFIPNATPLLRESGPQVARRLKEQGADIVVITPG